MNSVLYNCAKKLLNQSKCRLQIQVITAIKTFCTQHAPVQGQEKQITINNLTINYVKVGNGNKAVLCFPGALGTIWSDFTPQVSQLNRDKFTIVAFDPPGYGYSRPPNREFTLDFYEKDATIAHDLMKELGFSKFSPLGWSDGGISSLILAGKYPAAVEKLVIWGANSYILPEDVESYEKIRDIKQWSEKAKAPLVKLYGEQGLQDMWSGWCDVMVTMQQRNGGNICMKAVSKISCPTLILHGAKDPVVIPEHPNYLNANIKNSRLHIFPQGKHNIHLRYADEFNKIVTEFIME